MKYDYECEKCGVMEIDQSIKDDALVECPECGCDEFQRIITGGCGFVLKDGGSGWARDGYSKSSE